ncbi:MAG: Methylmalonyl-CoA mutase small subunit [candidate division BRC1 bacterium ADurb.BinA292]|nr:MAG: Methylmalonyl-CoA mutase small subunit [candidate division BRC1 bacterium ADurb.BinA292]
MSNPSFTDQFPPVSYEAWRRVVEQDLAGASFEKKLVTQTYEGVSIQPIYTRRDWPVEGDRSGLPGQPPFTRGARPVNRRPLALDVAGWDIRQEHRHPALAVTNQAVLADLERGATSVQFRLDAAARAGLDGDDPAAGDLAGQDGVMIYSSADLGRALDQVLLEIAGIGLDAGAQFLPAAGLLVALLRERGLDPARARVAFNADPLAALAEEGRLPTRLDEALDRLAELAAWTSRHMPSSRSVCVGTSCYHRAGATAVQDLAFSMATGVAYLRAMLGFGLTLPAALNQLLFSYSVGCNQFLAIAKLRAARRLWARVAEACGAEPRDRAMALHVRNADRIMTVRDPWVNMLRTTVCCFAGAAAGAESITITPFDSQVGLPDDFSRRIARNTQVILMEESHLGQVMDPGGGSWYIERLTEDLAAAAWKLFQEIEARGGMGEAIVSGWVKEQIEAAYQPREKNLARRKDAITGVSEFPNLGERSLEPREPDRAALREEARQRLEGLRRRGNVGRALQALEAQVRVREGEPGELMETIIADAQAGATIGELAQSLDGGHEAVTIDALVFHTFSEPYEALRAASDEYAARAGHRPSAFLVNLGPVAQHTARAGYARNFLEAGGFEVIDGEGCDDAAAAGSAFAASGAGLAVICSSDAVYQQLAAPVAGELKRRGARRIVLAGRPGENEASWREAGIDTFIHIGCDVLGTLRSLLKEQGVEVE